MTWRRFVPLSIRERIEVDSFALLHLLEDAAANVPPHSLVLDAGAGEGQYRQLFNHTQYTGVDLAVGDSSWDYSELSALNNLEFLSFDNEVFDVVVCTQVLEHVREPGQIISEFYRVLKPGGMLILSAPQRWHEHQIPYDYFRYTSYGLAHLLTKAHLEVEEIVPLGGYFWFLAFQLRLFTYYTFSRNSWSRRLGPIATIGKLASAGIFEIALPLLLFYVDPIDQIREATLGHFCIARRPLVKSA